MPSSIQRQIKPQSALMQLIHNDWLFHKNNRITRQGEAASKIRPYRTGPKHEHFYTCTCARCKWLAI